LSVVSMVRLVFLPSWRNFEADTSTFVPPAPPAVSPPEQAADSSTTVRSNRAERDRDNRDDRMTREASGGRFRRADGWTYAREMSATEPATPSGPASALPSVGARVAAFVAVFVGGAAGALIGVSFASLQCSKGGCELSRGIWLWLGSIAGALGVAVVTTLTLRAFGEWSSVRASEASDRGLS
jgi:hypothetical protein